MNILSSFTHRKASDYPAGHIGSLYDGYKDRILGQVNLNRRNATCKKLKLRQCIIITGKKYQNKNILKKIGVENELRLSALLNLTDKTGIAAIIDCCQLINQYTRFFYYS